MPYLYSLAWKVTDESYTIMRHLVFDYQNDSNVFSIKDQFMFGPAFLVNPVTSAGATTRSVYLPAGLGTISGRARHRMAGARSR
jgi:alpha-D-xyloside xylohydrolase